MNATPTPPTEAPGTFVLVDEAEWAEVRREMDDILATVARLERHLAGAMPRTPVTRRYTKTEARIRIGCGIDPAHATDAQKASAISENLFERLAATKAGGYGADLDVERFGGRVTVTEAAIQRFEAEQERRAARIRQGRTNQHTPRPMRGKASTKKAPAVNETAEAPNAAR